MGTAKIAVAFVIVTLAWAMAPAEAAPLAIDVTTDRPFYNVGETAKVSLKFLRLSQNDPKQALISVKVIDPDGQEVSPSLKFLASAPTKRDFSVTLEKIGEYRFIACAYLLQRSSCDTTRLLVEEVQSKSPSQLSAPSQETKPIIATPTAPESRFPYWVIAIPPLGLALVAVALYRRGGLGWRFRAPAVTMFVPRKRQSGYSKIKLELEREEIMHTIREIEREHRSGRISDEAYVKLRMKYMDLLRGVTERLKEPSQVTPMSSSSPSASTSSSRQAAPSQPHTAP